MSKRKWTVMLNAKCIIFYPLFERVKTLPYKYAQPNNRVIARALAPVAIRFSYSRKFLYFRFIQHRDPGIHQRLRQNTCALYQHPGKRAVIDLVCTAGGATCL